MQLINNRHSNDILKSLPGYVFWRTNPDIYGDCNQAAANLLGFGRPEEMAGATEHDMACPAVHFADVFIDQNKKALSGKSLTIIDINTYANNEPHLLLVKKFPIVDATQKINGMIIQAQDIEENIFYKIAFQLMNTKYNKNGKSAYSYTLNGDFDELNLTPRESECLFLLSYGKTSTQIAAILNISVRTVEVHLDKLKTKVNVRSKPELIEWAICRGYIYTIPKSLMADNGLSMIVEEFMK